MKKLKTVRFYPRTGKGNWLIPHLSMAAFPGIENEIEFYNRLLKSNLDPRVVLQTETLILHQLTVLDQYV